MKVFVTGAGGMIGRAVVQHLIKKGHAVVALVRSPNQITYADPDLQWIVGDIRSEDLEHWMCGSDAVVHLAARKADEADSGDINVEGTRRVVVAAEKCGVQKIVHTSSVSTKFATRGIYGETKLQADEIVKRAAVSTVIFKPSVVYGDLSSGILGSIARYVRLPFVPLVGPGLATSRPIYVDDVARAIELVLARQGAQHAEYDLGGPEEVTLNELVQIVSWQVAGRAARIFHLPLPLGFFIAAVFSFLPKPPITRSNIRGMNEHAIVDIEPFCRDYEFRPLAIADGLRIIQSRSSDRDEAHAIMQYVSAGHTSDYYVELYKKAIARAGIADHRLDREIYTSEWALRGLDLVSRFTHPDGIFRKKLAIASAIYEASPLSAEALLPRERAIVSIVLGFFFAGVKTLIASIYAAWLWLNRERTEHA